MNSDNQFKKLAMKHLIDRGERILDNYKKFVELIDLFSELAMQPVILQQATYSIQDKPKINPEVNRNPILSIKFLKL